MNHTRSVSVVGVFLCVLLVDKWGFTWTAVSFPKYSRIESNTFSKYCTETGKQGAVGVRMSCGRKCTGWWLTPVEADTVPGLCSSVNHKEWEFGPVLGPNHSSWLSDPLMPANYSWPEFLYSWVLLHWENRLVGENTIVLFLGDGGEVTVLNGLWASTNLLTGGFPVNHWFLTQGDFCSQRTLDNIWRQFWLLQLGRGMCGTGILWV